MDRQFACLTYHVVGDGKSQYTASIEQLQSHLTFLRDEGYLIESFCLTSAEMGVNWEQG